MVDADKSLFNKAAAERKITDTKEDVADKKEVKEEESIWKPKTVKWNLFYAIQLGAILDNFGSAGLIMCMSPLMFYEYQVDQIMVGEDPIMSETQFKWLTTLVVRSFHTTQGLHESSIRFCCCDAGYCDLVRTRPLHDVHATTW